MAIKIKYTRYLNSEVATTVSKIISYVRLFGGIFSFICLGLIICSIPNVTLVEVLFVLGLIGFTVLLIVKGGSIEQFFVKYFPDPYQHVNLENATPEEKKEYEWAKKIVYELGANHPAVKEIAKIKGVSKREVIYECEEIIRRYNNKYH